VLDIALAVDKFLRPSIVTMPYVRDV